MKKLLIGLTTIGLLTGCGEEKTNNELKEESIETEETKKNEPTQEELDAKLKHESVEVDFVELNVDNSPVDRAVKATGEITMVNGEGGVGDSFALTVNEGKGFGSYIVENFSLGSVSEGDKVTIYGRTKGEQSELGLPVIVATIIEKN